jgi:hypothetical protein
MPRSEYLPVRQWYVRVLIIELVGYQIKSTVHMRIALQDGEVYLLSITESSFLG